MKKLINIVIVIMAPFFSNVKASCMDSDLVLAATGDTIFHGALHVQAFKKKGSIGFSKLWENTVPYLQQADLMYTNLEGPAAEGLYSNGVEDMSMSEVYSPSNGMYSLGEPGKSYTFNFHPESVRALVKDGFTLLSTASNHSLDRRIKGISKTLDLLNFNKVDYFGTKYPSDPDDSFVRIINKNNLLLAFVSCTYGTNSSLKTSQILYCYEGNFPNEKITSLVHKYSRIVDAVIVTPHWGIEYSEGHTVKQSILAKALVSAGAKAIIGHHPHIIQPLEYLINKKGQRVPVLYSLGNFVTNQSPSNWKDKKKNEARFKRRVGAVAFIGFSLIDNELRFNKLKLMPTYMKIAYEGVSGVRTLVPAYKELYSNHKILSESLAKAMKYFSKKFDKEVLSYKDLREGIVCP